MSPRERRLRLAGPGKLMRLAACAGVVVGTAALTALGAVPAAGAAAVPAGDHNNGAGPTGLGGGWGRGHGQTVWSGTVDQTPSSGATSFVLDVKGWAISSSSTPTTAAVTVNVTSSTTFTEPGVASPGITGLLAGDQVMVSGDQAGTNAVTATKVVVPMVHELGIVASAPTATSFPASFTMDPGLGLMRPLSASTTTGASTATVAVTVNVFATTNFTGGSSTTPGLAGLAQGDRVFVVGDQAGANTVNATSVAIMGDKSWRGLPVVPNGASSGQALAA